jgi:hypothetical protein
MTKQFDYDRAAMALIEAVHYGDEVAAQRFGVTKRSIRRWRAKSQVDQTLSYKVRELKDLDNRDWAKNLVDGILAQIDYATRAAQEASPKEPEAIKANAEYFRAMIEAAITKGILDARHPGQGRTEYQED